MSVMEIKAAVRKRDGYRCTECGMTDEEHRQKTGRGLEVHRIIPGSKYTIEGCHTLCRPCHGKHPRRRYRGASAPGDALGFPLEFQERIERVADKLGLAPRYFLRMLIVENLGAYERRAEQIPPLD